MHPGFVLAGAAQCLDQPRMDPTMSGIAMQKTYRIGQIVPSSNTTMETEIPAMLLAHQRIRPENRFTFHSSRMRMKKVVKEELAAMDAETDRCAVELSDARVDVLGYACLVAIMAMGPGYHRQSESRLKERIPRPTAPMRRSSPAPARWSMR